MAFVEEFLYRRIRKEDVPVDLTATMNIPEDTVKQYGSMVALRVVEKFSVSS